MHGLGNDFVVINSFAQEIQLTSNQVRLIADRHFGIGCDQLLLLAPSDKAGIDVRYLIYNADGGEVSQCGNGARCAAAYLRENGLIDGLDDGDTITAETLEGALPWRHRSPGVPPWPRQRGFCPNSPLPRNPPPHRHPVFPSKPSPP